MGPADSHPRKNNNLLKYLERRETMSIEIRMSVISPESGVQRSPAAFPPGMGGPPPGMAPPAPTSGTFAKRLDTLENKTVYLVDTGFGGSYNFMLQLQKWFKENMPSVKTVRRRKPGIAFMDDSNELWEEVKEKGDAAVLGVAG
jgi:hypothetical protein